MPSNIRISQRGAILSRAVAGAIFLLAPASFASQPDKSAKPTPPSAPGNVEWVIPSTGENYPQTDAQKQRAARDGRALPRPELLQPELDPALVPFTPTPNLKINKTLTARCSDVLPSLVEAWAEEFRKRYPDFSLELERPFAGSLGALELIEGNIDVVFVSRELKPTDISQFREKFGYEPFSAAVSGGSYRHFGFLDSIAFTVNRDNPIDKLSFTQLDAIFSSTRRRGGAAIRTWGDLGLTGEWENRRINAYGIEPWNGFEEFVRQRVLSLEGDRGEWRDDMHFDSTFFPLARRVAADPAGIGYTGLSAIDSSVKIIQIGVDEDGPFWAPTYEAVASGEYPLGRLIFLNTNRNPDEQLDPALHEFLRFILSRDGQAIVRQHGIFLPLRAAQVEASLAYIEE